MESGELIFIGFCSLAALNALFFAAYLWTRQGKKIYPNAILSIFLLITAYRITQILLHDLQDDFNLGVNVKTLFFFIPVFPLIGPMLFLYVKSSIIKDFQFRPSHLLHAIPFLLVFILDLGNRKNFPLSPDNRVHYTTYSVQATVILLQFLIYLLISWNFIQREIKKPAAERMVIENDVAYMLRIMVLIISVLWLIYGLYCFQTYFRIYLAAVVLEPVYYSVLIYWMLFVELKNKKISLISNFTTRYKSSALSADDSIKYKSLILDYINKNEVYKDHNITLVKLAKQLSLTTHILSQVINEQFSFNFNDFINSYRIEEAKKMLADRGNQNITIASIAYDSGFNTLSAFNTAFKKFTGLTPSAFRIKQSE